MPEQTKHYTVTDNGAGFTGGWRVCGPDGFAVYRDHERRLADDICAAKNAAHRAAVKPLAGLDPAAVPGLVEAAERLVNDDSNEAWFAFTTALAAVRREVAHG